MARRIGYPLPVLLLLTVGLFVIVSSKTEPQQQKQQQQPGVVVSGANGSLVASTDIADSSEEAGTDSSEDDDEEEGDDACTGGTEEEEEDDDGDEEGDNEEEEEEDEASLATGDEYEDELRALVSTERPSNDKEVSELLKYKRAKKVAESETTAKDKRVPTVKKELSTQKEILLADNETQPSRPVHAEAHPVVVQLQPKDLAKNEEPENYETYSVSRPSELLRKLSKRQSAILDDLRAYLLESDEGLLARSLLKLLSKLEENPQRREQVQQLLTNINASLESSRRSLETQKRVVQTEPRETTSTLTTAAPERPKPKKKKKKKKKRKKHRKPATTSPAVMATTEAPWSTTQTAEAKWRFIAERLFEQPWQQDDEPKVRYSMPSKPRTLTPVRRPLDDKERESLKALNSERQALMLKAAREYSQPRLMHFGKINTHQQTSSAEDVDDGPGYSNDRTYQRAHFGQLVSPSSSRLAYTRLREPMVPYPDQSSGPQYDFARNQEYLPPPGRDFAASKPWQAGGKGLWNWRQFANVPKPWLPWHSERDYFARLEQQEEDNWQQQQQQQQQEQNWSRQNFRDNLPPWLEEKEAQRLLHAQDKPREYGVHHKEVSPTWENGRNNNNSDLKNEPKHEEESPKLTMKTWNSLTSDPATWPFKLPGAKPWPKDENGKTYNPNAELVRKLGLYSKSSRLKESKQPKPQKSDKQANDTSWQPGKAADKASWYNGQGWSNEPPDNRMWNLAKANWAGGWPGKWKQFAYHKVTPTSKSGMTLDKPGKNAFIAVSALSSPKYGNDWRKNDIEEVGQVGPAAVDPNDPTSQMRMNAWKKSGNNATVELDKPDALESQLEYLKEKETPVLLEVNVSIKNSTFHQASTTSSTVLSSLTEKPDIRENKEKDDPSSRENYQTKEIRNKVSM